MSNQQWLGLRFWGQLIKSHICAEVGESRGEDYLMPQLLIAVQLLNSFEDSPPNQLGLF